MTNKQNLGDLFTSNSSVNTSVNSTSFYINDEDIVLKIYDSSNTQVFL